MHLKLVVLGPGCPKCKMLKRHAQKAVELFGAAQPEHSAEYQVVTDINEIVRYNVLSTPVLVINEHVFAVGRIPHTQEILDWMSSVTSGGAPR